MSQSTQVLDEVRPAGDFELDIEFVEAGGTVEHIIKMTEDQCGTTCESACTSC